MVLSVIIFGLRGWYPVAKNLPDNVQTQKTWVLTLGQEDPLEENMATHSSILAWRIPWEPGGFMEL